MFDALCECAVRGDRGMGYVMSRVLAKQVLEAGLAVLGICKDRT